MNLTEFIIYSQLAGIVRSQSYNPENKTQYILIARGIITARIWYHTLDSEAFIIKSNLDTGPQFHLSPALSTIAEEFFPSK